MKGTKNNIWKVFAINLGKSILGICILIAVDLAVTKYPITSYRKMRLT